MSEVALVDAGLQLLGVDLRPPRRPRVEVVDRRHVDRPRRISRGPAPGRAVVVHQLDCELDLVDYQVAAAGGDPLEALLQRAMGLEYHVVALGCRVVLLNHPHWMRMSHAGAGNGGVGLGIEGRFPTRARDDLDRRTPIRDVVEVGREALRRAVSLAAGITHDGHLDVAGVEVQAHRQWAADRGRDPGEEIWREVVLPVVAELGLRVDYERRGDGGLPIPREWDPAATHDLMGRRL